MDLDFEEDLFPVFDDMDNSLLSALQNRRYPTIYALLGKLTRPLSGEEAAAALNEALHCTPRCFRSVLDRCEPGEYASTHSTFRMFQRSPLLNDTSSLSGFSCRGTILTLAAAWNAREAAELLLQRGWDPNSSSLRSRQALAEAPMMPSFPLHALSDGRGGSAAESSLSLNGLHAFSLATVTPLAAALMTGAVDTVSLLLDTPGVRVLECDAVRAALALVWENQSGHYTRCRALLERRLGSAFFLRLHPVDCLHGRAPRLLQRLYREGSPTEADSLEFWNELLRQMEAPFLSGEACQYEQIAVVLKAHPGLVRCPAVVQLVLRHLLQVEDEELRRTLVSTLASTGLTTLDLDPQGFQLGMHASKQLKELLSQLSEHFTLSLSREQVSSNMNSTDLRLVARYVSLGPPDGKKLSRFAQSVLSTGSIALLRQMYRRGLMDGEPTDTILEYLQERDPSSTLRSLVLMHCEEKEAPYAL